MFPAEQLLQDLVARLERLGQLLLRFVRWHLWRRRVYRRRDVRLVVRHEDVHARFFDLSARLPPRRYLRRLGRLQLWIVVVRRCRRCRCVGLSFNALFHLCGLRRRYDVAGKYCIRCQVVGGVQGVDDRRRHVVVGRLGDWRLRGQGRMRRRRGDGRRRRAAGDGRGGLRAER